MAMDDLQSSEESAFVQDEVERIITPSIEAVLGKQEYDQSKVPQWIDAICEGCMEVRSQCISFLLSSVHARLLVWVLISRPACYFLSINSFVFSIAASNLCPTRPNL